MQLLQSNLSPEQRIALISETGSIRYALDSTDRLLRTAGPLERERDAIFAICSIGVEKLAKVALCLVEVAEGRGWPTVQVLNKSREGWGHSIVAMDDRLRCKLTSRIIGFEYEEMLRRMLCTVGQDAVWLHVAETLEAYATKGRFFYLDILAGGGPDPAHDPIARWESAERAALNAEPSLRALQNQESWEKFEAALLNRVADSIRRWWGMIGLMGMHGVLGAEGKSFGADVLPDGAVPFPFSESC